MTKRKDESNTPGEGAPRGAFAKKFRQVAPDVSGKQRADDILALAAGAGTFPRDVIEPQTTPHRPAALGISIYHPYSSAFSMLEQPLLVPPNVTADWLDIPSPAC